ncbi:MAG: phosphatase PAP2 family protein [Chloroflexi bacterium]|nr:phosphatase PAP2 family protein [Chloroflexota bacterium]
MIAAVLGTLALYILAWVYPTFPGDESILLRFQSLRSGWLDETAKGFANFGVVSVFIPAAAFLMAFLLMARRYADVAMVFAGLMVIGIGNGLKVLVDRPRPDHQIFDPIQSSFSFPSGHSLLAVILGGLLIYLVESWVKPVLLRRAIQIGLVLVVVAMGASRVYMGVHWPSDVIGSYLFGLLALVGLITLRNAVASDP